MGNEKNEKKQINKKKTLKILIISVVSILLIIAILLFLWFNRKFEVNFKYNNKAFDDISIKVKYSKLIDKKYVENDIKIEGLTFAGWFETYYLNNEEIKSIKKDSKLEENICKNGFELDLKKEKCISKEEFNFKTTKIKKDTIIEAMWIDILFSIDPTEKTINENESFKITTKISGTKDKSIEFKSEDEKIATVDENGKVKGIKKGETTIIVKSNGIKKKCNLIVKEIEKKEEPKKETPKEEPKKDEGTISLKATDQCLIGTDSVKITAKVSSNAINKTINWNTKLKCFNVSKLSETEYSISRNKSSICSDSEELNPVVSANLNNGNKDSLKFTYEPTLTFTVYDNGREIQPSNGVYKGNNITIKTNSKASFTGKNDFTGDIVKSKTDNSVTIKSYAAGKVTIATSCGQTKTLTIQEVIN